MYIKTGEVQYRKINIDNCTFTGAALSITNPVWQVDITNSDFNSIFADPFVKLTWDREENEYDIINIKDNTLDLTIPLTGPFPIMWYGVELLGFNEKRMSNFDKITISGNEFSNTAMFGGIASSGAILLNNTSALVLSNVINGDNMLWGIRNRFTSPTQLNPYSNSYFCSNDIEGCFEGIYTNNWRGHAKLNILTNCGSAYMSEGADDGGLTYNEISSNTIGVDILEDVSRVDMSGIHTLSTDVPAYNTLYQNGGSIHMIGSVLIIGSPSTTVSVYSNYGQNNVITSTVSNKFIHDYASTSTDIGGINENYWGYGSWGSLTAVTNTTDFGAQLTNVTYLPSSPSFASSSFTAPSAECGVEFDFGTRSKGSTPQSISFDTALCDWLVDRGERNYHSEVYDRAYDTLKIYIENCADHKNSWVEFRVIGTSVQYQETPPERYIGLREWLKKVLYYNTTVPNYFCADVQEIMSSFFYFEGRGKDYLGALAVSKEIYEQGLCKNWDFIEEYHSRYANTMQKVLKLWRDTVQDSIATPVDTSLPSLEDLDLTILRGQNQGAVSATHEPRLGELIAARNPFADVLELKYRLAKSGMVRIDVYDLLGRSVYSEGQGYKQDGEYALSLQSKSWSSGSYYVRLSTPSGEVKTVKVVRE